MIQVSRPAPDFNLEGVDPALSKRKGGVNKTGEFSHYKLSAQKGKKWTVVFFYPMDFTFICPTEITAFSKHFADFKKLDAIVYGISTDSVHSHKAWLKDLGALEFPLLSDMSHVVSREYGVLLEEKGIALRGTFIIDPDGILRYALYHDNNVGRSVTEVLRVLQALQTGELCPVEWAKGKKTLGKA